MTLENVILRNEIEIEIKFRVKNKRKQKGEWIEKVKSIPSSSWKCSDFAGPEMSLQ